MIGSAIFAGWMLDVAPLTQLPGLVTMKTNTALASLLCGAAILLLARPDGSRVGWTIGRACACLVLLLGLLTLSQHLGGFDLGIDQLFATEPPGAPGVTSPNRMGPPASLCFTLLGIALLLLGRSRRKRALQQVPALASLLVALIPAVGYCYDIDELYGIARFTGIAWPTDIVLLAASAAILCLRPSEGVMQLVTTDDPAGLLVRRLLVPMFVVPLALGWLPLAGSRLGVAEVQLGVALQAVAAIAIFSTFLYYAARRLRAAETELERQREFSAVTLHSIGDGVIVTNAEGCVTFMNGEASEQRLRWALACAGGGAWDWDVVSGDAWWSPEMFELWGVEPGAPIQLDDALALVHEGDRERVRGVIDQAVARNSDFSCDFRIRHSTHGERWMSSQGRVVSGNSGRPTRLIGITHDITERKQREERVTKLARLYATLSQVNEAIVRTRNETALFTEVCRIVKQTGGFPLVWIGRVVGDEIIPAASFGRIDYLKEIKVRVHGELGRGPSGTSIRENRAVVNPDFAKSAATALWRQPALHYGFRASASFPLCRNGAPMGALTLYADYPEAFDEEQVALLEALSADLSFALDALDHEEQRARLSVERDQLLESERAARSAAEQAIRVKDDFLAMVSHELRTPLNAMLGWVGLLKKKPSDFDKGLTIIERNARAQAQLIEDLLDINRIVSGKFDIESDQLSLAQVINQAVDSMQPIAAEKQIAIEVCVEDISMAAYGDGSRLQQVFWNLLTNAVKFTPARGKIAVSLCVVGNAARVTVADDGEGIEAEFLPRLFDRFAQGEINIDKRKRGLGLGLAISRAIVELHGGTITAVSAGKGHGAAFTVTLPLHGVERSVLAPEGEQIFTALPAGISVLVVEDEKDSLEFIVRVLKERGAIVEGVSSAREALAALERTRPDIIVSDVGMSGMDGYAFMRTLRAFRDERRRIPAIAVTAFARKEDEDKALEAGFTAHVPKPINVGALLRVIVAACRQEHEIKMKPEPEVVN